VVKEKVYGGKDLLKSQVLSSEWNTERVREDASGDSEDGEDDELPWLYVPSEIKKVVARSNAVTLIQNFRYKGLPRQSLLHL